MTTPTLPTKTELKRIRDEYLAENSAKNYAAIVAIVSSSLREAAKRGESKAHFVFTHSSAGEIYSMDNTPFSPQDTTPRVRLPPPPTESSYTRLLDALREVYDEVIPAFVYVKGVPYRTLMVGNEL